MESETHHSASNDATTIGFEFGSSLLDVLTSLPLSSKTSILPTTTYQSSLSFQKRLFNQNGFEFQVD